MALTPCVHCGGPTVLRYVGLRDKLFGVPGRWDLLSCTREACGLAMLHPPPDPAEIPRFYSRYYTHSVAAAQPAPARRERVLAVLERAWQQSHGFGPSPRAGRALLGYLVGLHPLWTRRFRRALRGLPPGPPGRLLDVGCGNGDYLHSVRALGWKGVGQEVDAQAAKVARARGLEVHVGPLESCALEAGSFDVVTLNHVIEHAADPAALLSRCASLLRPGGRAVVITPNLRSAGHAWFGRAWRGLEPPRHLQLFTRPALESIAFRSGLAGRARTLTVGATYYFWESEALRRPDQDPRPLRTLGARLLCALFSVRAQVDVLLGGRHGEELVLIAERVPVPDLSV